MKILLIGHSVLDRIETREGTATKPGGLFYSAVTMANLKSAEDEIYLLTSYDNHFYNFFEPIYGKLNINFSNLTDKIPVVHLKIYDDKERDEIYENFTSKLKINDGIDFTIFDGILINMITGNDISVEDLEKIRKSFRGKIYFDIHSLSRTTEDGNRKVFRKIPEAEKWLTHIDILQCNDLEATTIIASDNLFETARYVLERGPEYFIVTLKDKGVRLFSVENNELESVFIAAHKFNGINKVGCGDTFGASFFYSYIRTGNIYYSLKFANLAAGLSTTYYKPEDFGKLKNDIDGKID